MNGLNVTVETVSNAQDETCLALDELKIRDLMVPFDKVIEILSETESNTKDEICIALEKLKIRDTASHHSGREQDSYNQAIADAIQAVKNHYKGGVK